MTELTLAEFRSLYLGMPRPKHRPKICWYCYAQPGIYRKSGDYYVIRGLVLANRSGLPDKIYSEVFCLQSDFDNALPREQERIFKHAIDTIEARVCHLIAHYSEVAAP
jgi:hypothetical protein